MTWRQLACVLIRYYGLSLDAIGEMTRGQMAEMVSEIGRVNLILDPPDEEHMSPSQRNKLDLIRRGAKFRHA